ncbi:MAG: tetratricopeptide repeat protein [Desulfomonilaceae bacterium]
MTDSFQKDPDQLHVSTYQVQRNYMFPPKLTLIAVLSLIIINVAVYHRAPYQKIANYDDVLWVQAVKNPGLATLRRIFTWDLTWGEAGSKQIGYYAPLPAASIMTDLWLGKALGRTDTVLKSTNLALHLLNSILVLWLIRSFGFSLWISFTVAALLAVHPLQVSTVAWIPERKNLLMGFFFLVGLLCYSRFRQTERKGLYWGAVAAYCLSLLSKPSAVVFGPCMIMTDLFLFDRKLTIRSLWRATPVLVLGILWTVLGTTTEGAVVNAPPLWDRILLFPFKIWFLLGKFVFPSGLSLIYPPSGIDSTPILVWLPAVVFVIVGILLLAMHRLVPLWGILWGVSFYVLNLIPSSGIVPFVGMNELWVADHYQYLAIVGASLSAVLVADNLVSRWTTRKAFYGRVAFTVISVFVLSTVSIILMPVWDNGETLWKNVIARYPASVTAHYNYAHYLDDKGRLSEAAAQYRKAAAVDENLYQAYNNLGIIMMKQGRLDAAVGYFEKCIQRNRRFGEPHLALAKIRFFQGSYKEALEHCREARLYGADCRPEELQEAIREKMNQAKR